jgi:hypothetical protein
MLPQTEGSYKIVGSTERHNDAMKNNDLLPKMEVEFSQSGRILAPDGSKACCEYSFHQRSNGNIQVQCELTTQDLANLRLKAREVQSDPEDEDEDWWDGELKHLTFEGLTPAALPLRLTNVDFVAAPDEKHLHFHVAQAAADNASGAVPSHLVFRLVNHEMPIIQASTQTLPSGFTINGDLLSLEFPSGPAYLRGVENDDELVKQLESGGGVAVTTELVLPLLQFDDFDAALEVAHRCCCVLTLLSGNRVNWLNYNVFDANGGVLRSGLQNAVTRDYQDSDLLNALSDSRVKARWGADLYKAVINRMMSRFEEQERKWNLVMVINSWHEAISSEHFLEQQGQLLANCMEMLRHSYLKRGGQEFILSPDEFTEQQKALMQDFKALLKERFPSREDWTEEKKKEHRANLSLMSTHIKGANRYGFKHSIQEMACELNLFAQSVVEELQEKPDARGFLARLLVDATDKELTKANEAHSKKALNESISAFVTIRDHLTHQGRFCVHEVDEEAGWPGRRVNRERMRQERFMARFVAAFLASILGWQQPLPTPPILSDC